MRASYSEKPVEPVKTEVARLEGKKEEKLKSPKTEKFVASLFEAIAKMRAGLGDDPLVKEIKRAQLKIKESVKKNPLDAEGRIFNPLQNVTFLDQKQFTYFNAYKTKFASLEKLSIDEFFEGLRGEHQIPALEQGKKDMESFCHALVDVAIKTLVDPRAIAKKIKEDVVTHIFGCESKEFKVAPHWVILSFVENLSGVFLGKISGTLFGNYQKNWGKETEFFKRYVEEKLESLYKNHEETVRNAYEIIKLPLDKSSPYLNDIKDSQIKDKLSITLSTTFEIIHADIERYTGSKISLPELCERLAAAKLGLGGAVIKQHIDGSVMMQPVKDVITMFQALMTDDERAELEKEFSPLMKPRAITLLKEADHKTIENLVGELANLLPEYKFVYNNKKDQVKITNVDKNTYEGLNSILKSTQSTIAVVKKDIRFFREKFVLSHCTAQNLELLIKELSLMKAKLSQEPA